jgi:hypothetical protein
LTFLLRRERVRTIGDDEGIELGRTSLRREVMYCRDAEIATGSESR